jgi:hypothetical protein
MIAEDSVLTDCFRIGNDFTRTGAFTLQTPVFLIATGIAFLRAEFCIKTKFNFYLALQNHWALPLALFRLTD